MRGVNSSEESKKRTRNAKRILKDIMYPHNIHPALVPGVSIEDQKVKYGVDKPILVAVGGLVMAFVIWGVVAPEQVFDASSAALDWVMRNLGWIFTALATFLMFLLLILAFSKSAITTDLILSSEIMVISLNEVIDQPFWMRLGALIFVGIILTLGVYGAVGLLVKMDDIGMALNERHNGKSTVGNALVKGMPIVLDIIGVIGTAAMLWVGGHIVVKGLHEFGMNQPHEFIVSVTEKISNGALAWLAETGMSMVCGLVLGTVIATIVMAVKASFGKSSSTSSTPAEA